MIHGSDDRFDERASSATAGDGESIVDDLFGLPEGGAEESDEVGRARIDRLQERLARRMRQMLGTKSKSEDAA